VSRDRAQHGPQAHRERRLALAQLLDGLAQHWNGAIPQARVCQGVGEVLRQACSLQGIGAQLERLLEVLAC
jgi:hypothetical protein